MKKLIVSFLSSFFVLLTLTLLVEFSPLWYTTLANPPIRVTIDDVPVIFDGQAPVIIGDRTLVPVREVFEHLNFVPVWDGTMRQATLTRVDYTIVINIGSDVFTTNGVEHTLDVYAQIINDSTMLPIRALLESVGYELDWEPDTRTVLITTGQNPFQIVSPSADSWIDPMPVPASIEEFGAIIVAVGFFWENLWEHATEVILDEWVVETPEHPATWGFIRVLPSSGFSNISDIYNYLSQYYTEDELYQVLSFYFAEYDDMLFTRRYFRRSNWYMATHEFLTRTGRDSDIVVDTFVLSRYWLEDEPPECCNLCYQNVYTFRFVDGRIDLRTISSIEFWCPRFQSLSVYIN